MALVLSALAVGCRTQSQSGAIVGAGAGALAGAAIAHGHAGGAIPGGVLGALLGSEVGRQMDGLDELRLSRTLEATPTYQPANWVNPDTGTTYTVTPIRAFSREAGVPCREFRMNADVGARQQEVYGTACRQADGSWKIVDVAPPGP